MTKSLYIIGGSGVGKSSLMRHLLGGWEPGPYERLTPRELFGHRLTHPQGSGVYLGHLRDEYPGTDALSLSVNPHAISWIVMGDLPDYIFGEGARLANFKFLRALHEWTDLTIVHLTLPPNHARIRREVRGGKLIDEGHALRTMTGASNLAETCDMVGMEVVTLNGLKPIYELVEELVLVWGSATATT